MSDDLAAFLTARLDEDEAAAKATEHNDGPHTLSWTRGGGRHLTFDNGRSEDYESVFAGNWDRILIARDSVRGGPLAAHVARHDPARVLREVAAKRAILALHHAELIEVTNADGDERSGYWCAECDYERFPCPTLRHLGAVCDHPDYRDEWKP